MVLRIPGMNQTHTNSLMIDRWPGETVPVRLAMVRERERERERERGEEHTQNSARTLTAIENQ